MIDSIDAESFVGVYTEADALVDRWRTASSQAADAYARWQRMRDAASYAAYRASADRADAAQDELAAQLGAQAVGASAPAAATPQPAPGPA